MPHLRQGVHEFSTLPGTERATEDDRSNTALSGMTRYAYRPSLSLINACRSARDLASGFVPVRVITSALSSMLALGAQPTDSITSSLTSKLA